MKDHPLIGGKGSIATRDKASSGTQYFYSRNKCLNRRIEWREAKSNMERWDKINNMNKWKRWSVITGKGAALTERKKKRTNNQSIPMWQ